MHHNRRTAVDGQWRRSPKGLSHAVASRPSPSGGLRPALTRLHGNTSSPYQEPPHSVNFHSKRHRTPEIHAIAACAACNNGIKKMPQSSLPVMRNLPAGQVGSGRCCGKSTVPADSRSVTQRTLKNSAHQPFRSSGAAGGVWGRRLGRWRGAQAVGRVRRQAHFNIKFGAAV